MTNLQKRIGDLHLLGEYILSKPVEMDQIIHRSVGYNKWFTTVFDKPIFICNSQ